MPKVRITVVKRAFHRDLVDSYLSNEALRETFSPCPIFQEGQQFISEDWPSKPEGFCERAWTDIHREVAMVMYEAKIPWIEQPAGTAVTCCNDGLRPVSFLLECLPEGESLAPAGTLQESTETTA